MLAADSRSACWRCSSASCPKNRRATSVRMMTGIIWKVEALTTPVKKNISIKPRKKTMNTCVCKDQITSNTEAIMPTNTQNEIGRASCREREKNTVVTVGWKKKMREERI